MSVLVTPRSGATIRAAAALLADGLAASYPSVDFPTSQTLVATKRAILLSSDADLLANWGLDMPTEQFAGSYVVTEAEANGRAIGAIYGADEEGVRNAVHALLARLGHDSYLAADFAPRQHDAFDFSAWRLADATPFRHRIAVHASAWSPWPAWNHAAWKRWISRIAARRLNTVMLHWPAGHPALSGPPLVAPPDPGARRAGPGLDAYAVHAPRGDAARRELAWPGRPDIARQDVATTASMRAARDPLATALDHAKALGMTINIGVDLDAGSLHPRDAVARLAPDARWCVEAICLPRPDTEAGHAFHRETLRALLARYPQIDQLTLWLGRAGPSAWDRIALETLPEDWRSDEALAARGDRQAVAQRLASRITESLLRALAEIGRADIMLFVGSTGYDWLADADALHDARVAAVVLDRAAPDGRLGLSTPKRMVQLEAVSRSRQVVPIMVPAMDRALAGRPHPPPVGLHERLLALRASGLGVAPSGWLHDLWLANTAAQLWSADKAHDADDALSRLASAIAPPVQYTPTIAFLRDFARNAPISGADGDADWQRADAIGPLAERLAAQRDRRARLLAEVELSALRAGGADYLRDLAALDTAWAHYAAARHHWLLTQERRTAPGRWTPPTASSASNAALRGALRGLVLWAPEHRRVRGAWGEAVALPAWLPAWQRERWMQGAEAWRLHFGPAGPVADAAPARLFIDPDGALWRHAGQDDTGALAWRLDARSPSAPADPQAAMACERVVLLDQATEMRLGVEDASLAPGRYRLRALLSASPEADQAVVALEVRAGPSVLVRAEVDVLARAGTPTRSAQRARSKSYALTLTERSGATLTATPVHGRVALCGLTLERVGRGPSTPASRTVARPVSPALSVSARTGRIHRAPHGMRYRELGDYLQLPEGTVWQLPDGVSANGVIADGAMVAVVAANGERQAYRFVHRSALSTGRPVQASREQRTPIWGIADALAEYAVDGQATLAEDAQGTGGPFWATMGRDSGPGWLHIDLGAEYYLAEARVAWLSAAIAPAGAAQYRLFVSDGPGQPWRLAADRSDNKTGQRTTDTIDAFGRMLRVEVLDSSYVAKDLPGVGGYKFIGATEVAVHGGLLYSDSASLRVDYAKRVISVASSKSAAALAAQLRAVSARYTLAVWRGQAPLSPDAIIADGDAVLVSETVQPGQRERYALALRAE